MSLVRLVWGGNIYDSDSGGVAIEEWSCSLSLLGPPSPLITDVIDEAALLLKNFHTGSNTGIGARAAIEYVKMNEFDVNTGQQISDPTHQVVYNANNRGAVTSIAAIPIITALKVSLDDGSRNRRRKGGFYLPVFSKSLSNNGRYSSIVCTGVRDQVVQLFTGITTLTASYEVGVWSRADQSITEATRIRIGDVPDFISRRKGEMRENYVTASW